MKKGVYIYRPAGWANANTNLDIRGNYNNNNTITGGAPTVGNVPKVYAYTTNGHEQIYPAKDVTKEITLEGSGYNHYRWRNWASSPKPWGWRSPSGQCAQGYYGQDNVQDGGDYLGSVQRENIGWIGFGSAKRNTMPNANKVTKINSLRFKIHRLDGSGWYGNRVTVKFGLNKIANVGSPGSKDNNPHTNKIGSPVTIGKLNPAKNYIPGGANAGSWTTVNVDLNTTQGKAIAKLVMDWMKGVNGANSIVMYNGENKGKWTGYGTWSDNYVKIDKVTMYINYTSEG